MSDLFYREAKPDYRRTTNNHWEKGALQVWVVPIEPGRLVDREDLDYEAAVVEFTRWSLPARLGRRLEQKRNRVGAVRVVQAAIGGSDEK